MKNQIVGFRVGLTSLVVLVFGCSGDSHKSTTDPYQLGGTYHDYRSCEEQDGNPVMEPTSVSMSMPAETNEDMPDVDVRSLLPEGSEDPLQSDAYFLRIYLAEIDFFLDTQLEIDVFADDQGLRFSELRLRAYKDDQVSEPFAVASDVNVDENGQFVAAFENAVMPGDFSPTGSDVVFDLEFIGVVTGNASICGFVQGEVETLDLALQQSTFGGVPWSERRPDSPYGCSSSGAETTCERIEPNACPNLVSGENIITSCGIERTVRIRLPQSHSQQGRYKTVLLFHGINADQVDDIEEDTAMNRLVDPFDFILISPYSRRLAIEWDQGRPGDNPDVALVDDLLTCAQQTLGADPERLYLAGDSGGGMFTTFLVSQFAETVAAAAINSGGIIFDMPNSNANTMPIIYGWGGDCDESAGQNFSTFASDAIPKLKSNGHLVATCNHDTGHEWKPLFTPWFLEFLFAHRLNSPSPFQTGLNVSFPAFCTID
ncbi:MAG: PHB depolymerase family esterase [Myxococcota bacterium]|nr:PHB depolymerase family esterase [Myxococcota bacterium]